MTTTPFEQPAASTGVNWAELHQHLLLIDVHNAEDAVRTSVGEKPAVRATIHDVDTNTVYDDVLIFPSVLVRSLRPKVGRRVLGRLTQGQGKPGQNPPWVLADYTPQDAAAASSYLTRHHTQTLTQPAGGGDADDAPF